jgi:hypothetical protein
LSWNPDHLNNGGRLWSAQLDPALIVGITMLREIHALVTPFPLSTDPDDVRAQVWTSE